MDLFGFPERMIGIVVVYQAGRVEKFPEPDLHDPAFLHLEIDLVEFLGIGIVQQLLVARQLEAVAVVAAAVRGVDEIEGAEFPEAVPDPEAAVQEVAHDAELAGGEGDVGATVVAGLFLVGEDDVAVIHREGGRIFGAAVRFLGLTVQGDDLFRRLFDKFLDVRHLRQARKGGRKGGQSKHDPSHSVAPGGMSVRKS